MKLSITIISFIVLIQGVSIALSPQEQAITDVIQHIEKQQETQDQKIQTLIRLQDIIQIAQNNTNTPRPLLSFTKDYLQERISKYTTQTYNNQDHPYPETVQTRLNRHNNVRQTPVSLHPQLMQSAQIRAEHLSTNNIRSNTHRRISGNYNYQQIENWFKELGITFKNINGWTFSENIAYNTVRCQQDCDEALVQATQRARYFFYDREKPYNGPHYRAIVQENFAQIGIGIAVKDGRYHIVIHYAAQVSDAFPQLTKQ